MNVETTLITEFITARLDEWEATARAASGSTVTGERPGPWTPVPTGDEWEAVGNKPGGYETEVLVALRPGLERPPKVMEGYWGAAARWSEDKYGEALPIAAHIAANDPAHVLRTIARLREIVAEHGVEEGDPYGEIGGVVYWCRVCDHDRDYIAIPHPEEGCPTLRAIAAIWADHDDYDEGWAL